MTEKTKIQKILFYTSISRLFRSTLIGHLYEISQKYPVVLLSEKLDSETEKILADKKLFPRLEKVIPAHQFTGQKTNLFTKNRYLYKLAKDVIRQYRPDIVIAANDVYPFEMYLMRFAKEIRAINICFQAGLHPVEMKQAAQYLSLIKKYLKAPFFLPVWTKKLFVNLRDVLGHFLYYWVMPLMVGQKPFLGQSSFIFWKGGAAMRDGDFALVFSKRDYDVYLKDGTPAEKLYILAYPLKRKTREFFEKTFFNRTEQQKVNERAVTLLLPAERIGFRKDNHSLISKEERKRTKIEIVNLVAKILKGWMIFIKPHPEIKNIEETKKIFESLSDFVKVVEPSDPVDRYIEMADVVIGPPRSSSTALFTASLQCPEKPILSLDFHQELLGDVYKDFEGIEYIDSQEKFIKILELIQNDKYQKKYPKSKEKELKPKEFSNTIEAISLLYKKVNF